MAAFATYAPAIHWLFFDVSCSGESLPPMALVNGFDHDRSRDRHSMSSDLDDEEEDYPREVSHLL